MYSRSLRCPRDQSFFLFGPRGTGKTAWLRNALPEATTFDLLDDETFTRLAARPGLLGERVPRSAEPWVVIDEVQRLPRLLDEVHRLIESRGLRFAPTGSSARKLRGQGVNLRIAAHTTRVTIRPFT